MLTKVIGPFTDISLAIRRFVNEDVIGAAMSESPPLAIGIEIAFIRFLHKHKVTELHAIEVFATHREHIRRQILFTVADWSEHGLPLPVAFSTDDEWRLVCWQNPSFVELTGYEPTEYAMVYAHRWIASNARPAFLIPSLVYLKAIGCDRIFVTDGSGDEGVDCIGRIGFGPLRSTVVLVQAKSKLDHTSTDELATMYARLTGVARTKTYAQYLEALEVSRSLTGSAFLNVVTSNGEFKKGARELAWRLGLLLRPRRQMASAISSVFSAETLVEMAARLDGIEAVSLTRNLSDEMDFE